MLGETKQATAATTSLIYITLGALIDVWTIIYYFYLRSHGGSDIAFLYVSGFFFTGLVLFLIGLAVGRIGIAARPAEVAPVHLAQTTVPNVVADPVVTPAVAAAEPMATAAAVAAPAAPVSMQPVTAAPVERTVIPAAPSQLVPNA